MIVEKDYREEIQEAIKETQNIYSSLRGYYDIIENNVSFEEKVKETILKYLDNIKDKYGNVVEKIHFNKIDSTKNYLDHIKYSILVDFSDSSVFHFIIENKGYSK